MKKTLLLMTALGALCVSGVKADTLLTWDFRNAEQGANSIDGSSLDSRLYDPTLTMSGALTPYPAPLFVASGWNHNGISLTNSDYFEFTIDLAEPGYSISLSSITARVGMGGSIFSAPEGATFQWAYSIGGGAFHLIDETFNIVGSSGLTINQNLDTIQDLQGVTQSISFRIFASASSLSSPTNAADNIGLTNILRQSYGLKVDGTVAPSAVPEPHEWAVLTGLMLGGLVWVRIRRRAQLA